MSAANFVVHDHKVLAQHIRELPNALAVEDGTIAGTLHLSLKQYVPKNNINPQPGDITIIATHCNEYGKEIYEPLWDDLIASLPGHVRIRGIWMADMVHQGQSYLMNEQKLSTGYSWDDHARDLLHIVNVYRDQMVPPIMAVGHSMGAVQILQLSQMHPRLFHAVSLLDPWFTTMVKCSPPEIWLKQASTRKQVFDSREHARTRLGRRQFYKAWDRRCFDRYIETGFREGPTLLAEGFHGISPVTTAVMAFNTGRKTHVGAVSMQAERTSRVDRLVYPDAVYDHPFEWLYCMPQCVEKVRLLPHLRPRTLFLYGKNGAVHKDGRKSNHEAAGTGNGGSGGARLGCVESDEVAGGHLFPFENPGGTAKRLAVWLEKELSTWREEKKMLEEWYGYGSSPKQRQQFPPPFSEIAKSWAKHGTSKL